MKVERKGHIPLLPGWVWWFWPSCWGGRTGLCSVAHSFRLLRAVATHLLYASPASCKFSVAPPRVLSHCLDQLPILESVIKNKMLRITLSQLKKDLKEGDERWRCLKTSLTRNRIISVFNGQKPCIREVFSLLQCFLTIVWNNIKNNFPWELEETNFQGQSNFTVQPQVKLHQKYYFTTSKFVFDIWCY